MPHFSQIRWSFFRISPRYYSGQFSQVIVLFHFSRKSQNKKFLEFFQLFAALIEMEKCRLFFALLRLACLIVSYQALICRPRAIFNGRACSQAKHNPSKDAIPLLPLLGSPHLFFSPGFINARTLYILSMKGFQSEDLVGERSMRYPLKLH